MLGEGVGRGKAVEDQRGVGEDHVEAEPAVVLLVVELEVSLKALVLVFFI